MAKDWRELRDTFPEHRYPMLDFWLDEAIWGHRLYDQSSRDVVLLEMLNVVDFILRSKRTEPFSAGRSQEDAALLTTSFRRSLVLRTILFNNSTLEAPLTAQWDNAKAWKHQLAALYEAFPEDGRKAHGLSGPEGFHYLQERFSSYGAYVGLVRILRQGAVEYESNKRWTSKFLFPYGPDALFEDLNDRTLSPDRRFFGRSGEIAYLMLARSSRARDVWEGLRPVLFEASPHTQRWHRALKSLQPERSNEPSEDGQSGQPIGYLPYETHLTFDIFGEDFCQLLRAGLPEYDAIPHLGTTTTFHLMHYLLVVAAEGLGSTPLPGSKSPVSYILEARGDRPDTVRRAARYSYQVNNELPRRRLKLALDKVREVPDVTVALHAGDLGTLKQAVSTTA